MIRRGYRTFHIAELDRLLAESEAIRRVVLAGHRDARVRDAERITDPDSGQSVWRITLSLSRRRKERR